VHCGMLVGLSCSSFHFYSLFYFGIIVGELCIMTCWWNDNAHQSISTIHPDLEIIEGELYIVAH